VKTKSQAVFFLTRVTNWEIINMDGRITCGVWNELNSSVSYGGQVEDCCEHGDEPSCSVKAGGIVDQLCGY
jgi:hypothetical protein